MGGCGYGDGPGKAGKSRCRIARGVLRAARVRDYDDELIEGPATSGASPCAGALAEHGPDPKAPADTARIPTARADAGSAAALRQRRARRRRDVRHRDRHGQAGRMSDQMRWRSPVRSRAAQRHRLPGRSASCSPDVQGRRRLLLGQLHDRKRQRLFQHCGDGMVQSSRARPAIRARTSDDAGG